MSSSADFLLVQLIASEVEYYNRLRLRGFIACGGSNRRARCHEQILFEGSYTYQSSAGGRRTRARRVYCERHAREWAARHGAAFVASETPPFALTDPHSDGKTF